MPDESKEIFVKIARIGGDVREVCLNGNKTIDGTLPLNRDARTQFIETHELYKSHHPTLEWVWTNDEGELWKDKVN